jgi:hypothetical protein
MCMSLVQKVTSAKYGFASGLTSVVKAHQLEASDCSEGGKVASLQDYLQAVFYRHFVVRMLDPYLDATGAGAGGRVGYTGDDSPRELSW